MTRDIEINFAQGQHRYRIEWWRWWWDGGRTGGWMDGWMDRQEHNAESKSERDWGTQKFNLTYSVVEGGWKSGRQGAIAIAFGGCGATASVEIFVHKGTGGGRKKGSNHPLRLGMSDVDVDKYTYAKESD